MIKILIQHVGKRDPVPPRTNEEHNLLLRVKLVKVVLPVMWDIWALRDNDLTSSPTVALYLGRGRMTNVGGP